MIATLQAHGVDEKEVAVGHDAASIKRDFIKKLYFDLAKFPGVATRNDHYLALALAVRDRLLDRWVSSARTYLEGEHRTVLYLSAEYLLGPQLGTNLLSLGMEQAARKALDELGLSLDELVEHETEPGLGNGGLGRLAACYMDSLATLDYPAIGHGIRYEFGIFRQAIRNGWQVELTDRWLSHGNPWEVRRWDIEHVVGFGGRTVHAEDTLGRLRVKWIPERVVRGVPFDTPVLGFGNANANFLRLWGAAADEELDLDAFQVGDYRRAVEDKVRSENISKVLYPNDATAAGKQLRLEQQYFFVSCALQDAIRLLLQRTTIDRFADKYAIQLNDTHPSLAVPELMRLLLDEHGMGWDQAWSITTRAVAYTNHTLLPEALETWPLELFGQLLPRHLEIVFEINRRFLDEIRERFPGRDGPGDDARIARMSLIGEGPVRTVRMANLASVASRRINGVAELHSRLLRETVLRDFAEAYPERFTNVTNGVTPRRFIALSNPGLSRLVTDTIGEGWLVELERLRGLERFADDAAFRERFHAVKRENKERLARFLLDAHGLHLDPSWMLDVQCKRIHEYKRQLLDLLHALWRFDKLRHGEPISEVPRTILLAGKAAPSYTAAKLIIKLAHSVGELIEREPRARRALRVVFVPDFNVKTAQRIYPAAELSEQISTAGMEASGTGNMKLAMNGALTIGTLDGANVEIREAVGAEHFFLFGLTAEEVAARREVHRPRDVVAADPELARVIDLLASPALAGHADAGLFRPLVHALLERDPFLVLADFRAYVEAQERVSSAYADAAGWDRSATLNVARMGRFSSDRSIRDYARTIWEMAPVRVPDRG